MLRKLKYYKLRAGAYYHSKMVDFHLRKIEKNNDIRSKSNGHHAKKVADHLNKECKDFGKIIALRKEKDLA